ncbi:hypothetical protein KKG65_04275 [Patescibacteria group bacterium]|nr:hypothetical protein [Patescibacteria group bacterium]
MKTKKKLILFVFVFVLLALTLVACRGKTQEAAPNNAAGVPVEIDDLISPTDLMALREYYRGGTEREANINNLKAAADLARTKFFTGIRDLIGNNQFCFKSVEETEVAIANAVMAEKEGEALVDALVTASVSGESATGICAELNHGIADYTVANRQNMFNTEMAKVEALNEYLVYLEGYPERNFMNDVFQTVADPSKVYKWLADKGIGATDFVWLPTYIIQTTGRDKGLCDYYRTGDFKAELLPATLRKFTGHETALDELYSAKWNSAAYGGTGECTFYRMAAIEVMRMSVQAAETIEGQNTGIDPGVTFPDP